MPDAWGLTPSMSIVEACYSVREIDVGVGRLVALGERREDLRSHGRPVKAVEREIWLAEADLLGAGHVGGGLLPLTNDATGARLLGNPRPPELIRLRSRARVLETVAAEPGLSDVLTMSPELARKVRETIDAELASRFPAVYATAAEYASLFSVDRALVAGLCLTGVAGGQIRVKDFRAFGAVDNVRANLDNVQMVLRADGAELRAELEAPRPVLAEEFLAQLRGASTKWLFAPGTKEALRRAAVALALEPGATTPEERLWVQLVTRQVFDTVLPSGVLPRYWATLHRNPDVIHALTTAVNATVDSFDTADSTAGPRSGSVRSPYAPLLPVIIRRPGPPDHPAQSLN